MKARSRREVWLTVVVSALALAALAWWLPRPEHLLASALTVSPAVWAAAAAGMALSYTLRALRLVDEWASRLRLGLRDALHLVLLHSAAIGFLPFRAGEAGYPWLLYRRHGVSLGASASSLLWLRLQDTSVGLLMAWVCVGPGLSVLPRAVIAALVVLALALGGRRAAAAGLRRLGDAPAAASGRWRVALHATAQVACRAVEHAPMRVWLWTVLNWLVKMASSALLIVALLGLLDSPAAWGPGYAGAVLGEIGGALPLQPPAGFGPYEGGVLLGARLQGIAADTSALLGAALVSHIFLLVLGGLYALLSVWVDSALGGSSRRVGAVADPAPADGEPAVVGPGAIGPAAEALPR